MRLFNIKKYQLLDNFAHMNSVIRQAYTLSNIYVCNIKNRIQNKQHNNKNKIINKQLRYCTNVSTNINLPDQKEQFRYKEKKQLLHLTILQYMNRLIQKDYSY